jgi:hypothetical protein
MQTIFQTSVPTVLGGLNRDIGDFMRNIHVLTLVIVYALNFGCDSKFEALDSLRAPLNPKSLAAETEEGGISSGGGGTLPTEKPMAQEDFDQVMVDAKRELRIYILNQQSGAFKAGDWRASFFQDTKNLGTVLEETDLEVKPTAPCLDSHGRAADATIFSTRPGAICLSSFRIIPKLSAVRAHGEIEALLLHEMSHLLGATEAQAISLQQEMVASVAYQNHNYHIDLWQKSSALQLAIEQLTPPNNSITLQYWYQLYDVGEQIIAFNGLTFDPDFARKPGFQAAWTQYNRLRLELAFDFARSQLIAGAIPPDVRKAAQENYDLAFGGKDQVKVREVVKNLKYGDSPSRYLADILGDEIIFRMKQADDLMPLLLQLRQYFIDEKTFSKSLELDGPLVSADGPWNKNEYNPWRNFIGNYKVIKTTCNSVDGSVPEGLHWSEIDVLPNLKDANKIRLRTNRDQGAVAIENYFRNADGYAIQIQGDDNHARLMDLVSHCWLNCQQRYKQTEITQRNGKIFFNAQYKSRVRQSDLGNAPTPLAGDDCTYELQRQP